MYSLPLLSQVMVGQNLEYNVGTVTYTTSDTETSLSIIIGASCGGGVLILLILVMFFVICCVMRRSTAKEKRFTNLLAQMELWESEMADECKRGESGLVWHQLYSESVKQPCVHPLTTCGVNTCGLWLPSLRISRLLSFPGGH